MKNLELINLKNQLILELYSNYLNEDANAITKKMINDFSDNYKISNFESLFFLLVGYFGLDIAKDVSHKEFAYEYIKPYLCKLSVDEYLSNPYYQNVKPKIKQKGNWEITYQTYKPYELFVWKDLTVDEDFKTFPNIGYFEEEFSYLTVLENNREWMLITPNEIETMKEAIAQATGKVITFGLGLGYFAYMVSLKEEVENVIIIERDQTVIDLFEENILPFFKYPEKIKIIKIDAIKYLKTMNDDQYNLAFVDLWHDVSDATNIYLKIKKIESKFKNTKFMYWIEESIISYLRWYLYNNFDQLKEQKLIKQDKALIDILDKENIIKYLKIN